MKQNSILQVYLFCIIIIFSTNVYFTCTLDYKMLSTGALIQLAVWLPCACHLKYLGDFSKTIPCSLWQINWSHLGVPWPVTNSSSYNPYFKGTYHSYFRLTLVTFRTGAKSGWIITKSLRPATRQWMLWSASKWITDRVPPELIQKLSSCKKSLNVPHIRQGSNYRAKKENVRGESW